MTEQTQKNNQGVLFKNRNKKEDKPPAYKGTITIDGKQKTLAAWVREAKDGSRFLSLVAGEVEKDELLDDAA